MPALRQRNDRLLAGTNACKKMERLRGLCHMEAGDTVQLPFDMLFTTMNTILSLQPLLAVNLATPEGKGIRDSLAELRLSQEARGKYFEGLEALSTLVATLDEELHLLTEMFETGTEGIDTLMKRCAVCEAWLPPEVYLGAGDPKHVSIEDALAQMEEGKATEFREARAALEAKFEPLLETMEGAICNPESPLGKLIDGHLHGPLRAAILGREPLGKAGARMLPGKKKKAVTPHGRLVEQLKLAGARKRKLEAQQALPPGLIDVEHGLFGEDSPAREIIGSRSFDNLFDHEGDYRVEPAKIQQLSNYCTTLPNVVVTQKMNIRKKVRKKLGLDRDASSDAIIKAGRASTDPAVQALMQRYDAVAELDVKFGKELYGLNEYLR